MPRSRESEGPQRQSSRGAPLYLRTSSSDSNSTRYRSTNNSPKLRDRQPPRGAQSNPNSTQKKLGTRITDLESQLGQAQVELKSLKGQLYNAKAAKKEAQGLLEKKTKKPKSEESHHETDVFELSIEKVALEDPKSEISEVIDSEISRLENESLKSTNEAKQEEIDETKPASDLTESPPEVKKSSFDEIALKDEEINLLKAKLEEKEKELEASRLENESLKSPNEAKEEEIDETKPASELTESPPEVKKSSFDEIAVKDEEINLLKAKLEEKEKELEASRLENESLKSTNEAKEEEIDETKPASELTESPRDTKKPSFDEINLMKAKLDEKDKEREASRLENVSLKAKINALGLEKSTNEAKQDEMKLKLAQLESELEWKKASETELKKKLDEMEVEKVGLEAEMKKMKIQTEQWRKAADAAAAVLEGEVEMNGRRVSERCGSMDKHIHTCNMFDSYVGSPGAGDDSDDGFGGGKRKISGLRMFGDLWKKKGQK